MKRSKGITLIALVITIIVLLILASVSISLTLGNNGVLNQATKAVTETVKADEKERIAFEIYGSYETDGSLIASKLKENMENHITDLEEIRGEGFPIKVKFNSGNCYKIDNMANIVEILPNQIEKGEKAPNNSNAVYLDSKGNIARIPAGFTVSNIDGETEVESGLVITDDSGNQFVWIPVGIAKKSNPNEVISLNRYNFDNDRFTYYG